MVFSVRLSVCPSVCLSVTPFWLCSHHQITMKFLRVITNDKSDVHAKGQGQGSKVKVTEVMTPFSRFRTVTPVWIHILRWNYAYSLMLFRRGALLFFKVIRQILRSHVSKNCRLVWSVPPLIVSMPLYENRKQLRCNNITKNIHLHNGLHNQVVRTWKMICTWTSWVKAYTFGGNFN